MDGRGLRRLLFLLLLAAVGYWFYGGRPSPSNLIDAMTRPLFQFKTVVDESEHKRVIAEPAVQAGEDASGGVVRENMSPRCGSFWARPIGPRSSTSAGPRALDLPARRADHRL